MRKISDKSASHHERPLSIRWRRYYDQIPHDANDRHPVDIAVDKCLGATVTRAQIVRLQERVVAKLGADAASYLELESLLNEYQREREKCYFDLGYEYGAVERLAQVRQGVLSLSMDADALCRAIRGQLLHTKVSSAEAILVLLECMWALAQNQRE